MPSRASNARPATDKVLLQIAEYVDRYVPKSKLALETARLALIDSLGCGFEALAYPACTKLMGPIVAGTTVPNGARVPGTQFQLDPVMAAFNIGCMIRWLDFNDTWLAAEWGHPSDNLGGILAVADYLSRQAVASGEPSLTVRDVTTAMVKAHEIQGVLALDNSFNRVGLDHVLLVRVASTAVSMVPWPDIMTTGMPSWPVAAHSLSSEMPSVSGIQMSSSTRSGRWRSRSRRASPALSASRT